jgi:hypothetical protein
MSLFPAHVCREPDERLPFAAADNGPGLCTFKSMKTKKLTEVLERIETWPPEAQDAFADFALDRDAGLGNGEYESTPEELSRKRRLQDIAAIGERRYDSIKEMMERDHFGAYVMINTETSDYIVAPTHLQVYTAFTERFGADAPSWSTRIGVSIFGLRKFAKLPFTNL